MILQTKWDDVDWDPLFELLKEPRSNWNWIRTTAPYTTLVRILSQKDYCFRMRNVGNSTHVNYLRIFLLKKKKITLLCRFTLIAWGGSQLPLISFISKVCVRNETIVSGGWWYKFDSSGSLGKFDTFNLSEEFFNHASVLWTNNFLCVQQSSYLHSL